MADLQIRDIADSIRQSLEGEATLRGQTLQEYLAVVLEQEAHRVANRALLREFTVANPRAAVSHGRYLTAVEGEAPGAGDAVLELEEPDED
jgi:hypothetical protein